MKTLLCVLLFLPTVAFAHGDQPSLEAQEGTYILDIGYDPIPPVAGVETSFDVDLFQTAPTIDFADFAAVDIRISRDGTELHTEHIENDGVNVPGFTYTFEEADGYDLDFRYLDTQEQLIVAHTFHLEAVGSARGFVAQNLDLLHYVLAIILLGASGVVAFLSFRARFRSGR